MQQMTKAKGISIPRLVFACFITLAAGGLASLLAGNNFDIYNTLKKPPLSPPSILFPIVWGILYILMGIAAYFVSEKGGEKSKKALTSFAFYLVLNILWPVTFFKKGAVTAAAVVLFFGLVMLLSTLVSYYRTDKKAAYLLLPTVLWSFFALYLNIGFIVLN